MAIKRLTGLSEVVDRYDLFLFDLCGILHNDQDLFQDAIQSIKDLKIRYNKTIVFLSNSSRPASHVAEFLVTGDINPLCYDNLVTSFEYFKHLVNTNKALLHNRKFFNLGKNNQIFTDIGIDFASSVEEADCLIISFFKEILDSTTEWYGVLEKAIKKKLPALCLNPDIIAPHGNSFRYTPGYFAKEYEQLGGMVSYFGKPYTPIYEFALNAIMKEKNIAKSRVLAIGDSLSTDIKGANDFGIDCLLAYANGIHKNENFDDESAVQGLLQRYTAYPSYISQKL